MSEEREIPEWAIKAARDVDASAWSQFIKNYRSIESFLFLNNLPIPLRVIKGVAAIIFEAYENRDKK